LGLQTAGGGAQRSGGSSDNGSRSRSSSFMKKEQTTRGEGRGKKESSETRAGGQHRATAMGGLDWLAAGWIGADDTTWN